MSASPECLAARDLAPEIALGIAEGGERAETLGHIEGCPDCRRHLQELSRVVDALLLLAPSTEPPVGLESRVLDALARQERDARDRSGAAPRWRRVATLITAAALGAAATFGAVWWSTAPQREFASFYERALAAAEGSYFGARGLQTASGASVGNVFAFAGEPSWLFVVATEAPADGAHEVRVQLGSGRWVELGSFTVEDGRGSLGTIISFSLRRMERVEVRTGETFAFGMVEED